VLWIEPLPEVFAALQTNLASFPRQRALQALVTDRDHQTYPFHVANNEGASSSILEFKDHQDIWPEVQFTGTLSLEGTTLVSLLRKHDIDPADYDALVMDTQGTELRVLQGAVPLLRSFLFIQTEVADFEAYAGCCQLHDLEHFLKKHGFREISRRVFARHPRQGAYYDVTYQRVDSE
jgi:FkbM family methyltransferase